MYWWRNLRIVVDQVDLAATCSRGRKLAPEIGPAVVASVALHVVGWLLMSRVLPVGEADPSTKRSPPEVIKLEFVTYDSGDIGDSRKTASKSDTQSTDNPPSESTRLPDALPSNSAVADIWHPLIPGDRQIDGRFEERRESEIERRGPLANLTLCPRYPDPSDLALSERCAGQPVIRSEGNVETARAIAERLEREAVDRGWVVTAVPFDSEQATLEKHLTPDPPAADVFGPWPWEAKH